MHWRRIASAARCFRRSRESKRYTRRLVSSKTATIVELLPRPPTICRRFPGRLSFFALALPPRCLIERPEPILNPVREFLRKEQNPKTTVVAGQKLKLIPWPD